jgi:hypothetical protein
MSGLMARLDAGFMGETYGSWFLFLLLVTFMWTAVVSINRLVHEEL